MAKKALINREVKRIALSKKYAAKRAAIFAIIDNASATEEERFWSSSATSINSS